MTEPQVPSGGPRPRLPAGETLIFDADDTLWENNIYFERATDAFLDYLAHSQLSHVQARARLLQVDRAHARMIGNAPRSDITPALAAGLHAVSVPHPHTWRLEHEEVQPVADRTLLHVERFADLQRHFGGKGRHSWSPQV